MTLESVAMTRSGPVARVTLARPLLRNAFNAQVIAELHACATALAADDEVRVVVLGGEGKVFSAGADLNWMAAGLEASATQVSADARALHDMLVAFDHLPQATIARVQGAAVAGGGGLVAVCDIVVAADDAVFGFSETRLGLVPAIVSPFVLRRIGVGAARELFLTGARFGAARAREVGLASVVVAPGALDATVDDYIASLLAASPGAVAAAKDLIRRVTGQPVDAAFEHTRAINTERRTSADGRSGVRAFLAKADPPWMVVPDRPGPA
jgi:methylglutaconyl-CoA hydratase